MGMTPAHWTFVLVVVAIILAMAFRRGVIILSILGIVALGFQSVNAGAGAVDRTIFAVQSVFKAMLMSGTQLFDIVLLIALMLAMLRSLQAQGVDEMMVAPLRKFMVGPWSAFFVIGAAMYIASVFFWPSPAVALIGTVLIPVAARVGLPAMGAAVAMNIAGHGMALSADPVIQAATRISASAANLPSSAVMPYTSLFSTILGVVAFAVAALLLHRDMRKGRLVEEPAISISVSVVVTAGAPPVPGRFSRLLAFCVPLVLLGVGALMIYRAVFTPDKAIYGSDATALLGGTAVGLLILASLAHEGHRALEGIVIHLTEGFLFAIRIFAPVIPIVAFFLLGDPKHAITVLGDGTPGYLMDVGRIVGERIEGNTTLLAFGILLIGMLSGVEGSGFSGLPLTGALSAALAGVSPENVAILAGAGQIASVWVGGGTIIPWSGVCAVAGIAGVSPEELARRNLIPVFLGLLTVGIVAALMLE